MDLSEIPVVILCGGSGVYLDGSGRRWSKGLVEIAQAPLVVHLMRHFHRHGTRRFVLACGHEKERYLALLAGLGEREAAGYRLAGAGLTGYAEVVDTGLATPTGERLRRVRDRLVGAPWFWATYSDTLSTVDLTAEARFHEEHGRIATCVAAHLPTRFRVLGIRRGEDLVRTFASRPVLQSGTINGGFYALQPVVYGPSYLGDPANQVFETGVLEELARDGHLVAFKHDGAWQHFDAERDLRDLTTIVLA